MIKLRGKDMLFIEAHTHIWDKLDGRRFDTMTNKPIRCGQTQIGDKVVQFLPPEWYDLRSPFEVYQLYEKRLGFDKAVLLQTPCYGPQYEYVNEVIAKHPGKYVTVGVPDPQDKNSYLETARLCLGEYKYKGLKFESPDIPFDMVAPENAFVFESILEYDAYCMIDLGWDNGPEDFPIDAMHTIVKRYQDLTFIFPHMGISHFWDPKEHNAGYPSLRRTLDMLALNKNIWFDLSGIPMLVSEFEEYPFPAVGRILKVAQEYNALDRVMWGSDYPTAMKASTYKQCVECVTNHCDFISDDDMEKIMGLTAEKVWFS